MTSVAQFVARSPLTPATASSRVAPAHPRAWRPGLRTVRLYTGLVMFAYVLAHLANHAVGNISLDAMEATLAVVRSFWRFWPVSTVLYGAILVHIGLGLYALYQRRMFRYRSTEMPQLAIGLLIPFMLINHIVVTRIDYAVYGTDKSYPQELYQFWVNSPFQGTNQVLVLLLAWVHGCIGLYLWLRLKRWFKPVSLVLLAGAVLVPTLALLGFFQGGRLVMELTTRPEWRDANLTSAELGTLDERAQLALWRNVLLGIWALLIAGVLLARALRSWRERRGGVVHLTYPDRRSITVPAGMSLLEASTRYEKPHAGVCGGRGRCGTCRVAVLSGAENLPPPGDTELAILSRIGADRNPRIRIGCQARPTGDITFAPMLPPGAGTPFAFGRKRLRMGRRQYAVCMFVEMLDVAAEEAAGDGTDLVFTANRFLDAVTDAVTRAGGEFSRISGAGMMALFGLHGEDPAKACRQAVDAAASVAVNLEHMARLLGGDEAAPVRFVAGLQDGPVTLGDLGHGDDLAFTAVGSVVRDAADLCHVARHHGMSVVIADSVCARAEVPVAAIPVQTVTMPGSARAALVRCAADAHLLFGALDAIADRATADANLLQGVRLAPA